VWGLVDVRRENTQRGAVGENFIQHERGSLLFLLRLGLSLARRNNNHQTFQSHLPKVSRLAQQAEPIHADRELSNGCQRRQVRSFLALQNESLTRNA
jgi:hypothetical protein